MSRKVRINITTRVNADQIRTETRDGEDYIIVPSATLPDNVIMNGVRYPADEIEKSFQSLELTPAPFGHPKVNGRFVSADHPIGRTKYNVGAHNENVRRENGRVFLDKVINKKFAEQTDNGKKLLEAVNAKQPIHTSTGLLCNLEPAPAGEKAFAYNARDIEFDHDAILLTEAGAATPEQGVGMFVNSDGSEIEVINSALERAEEHLDWAVEDTVRALERIEKASKLEQLKTVIKDALSAMQLTPKNGEPEMADDKAMENLSAQVNSLAEQVAKLGTETLPTLVKTTVDAAVAPLVTNLDEIKAANKAKEDAELADLKTKIIAANILTEEDAKDLTLNVARGLAKQAEPGKAAGINSAPGGGSEKDPFEGVDLNALRKESA